MAITDVGTVVEPRPCDEGVHAPLFYFNKLSLGDPPYVVADVRESQYAGYTQHDYIWVRQRSGRIEGYYKCCFQEVSPYEDSYLQLFDD